MRGKIALAGAITALLSSTSVNAAGAKAPQENGQQAEQTQPQGAPQPAPPKVKKSTNFLGAPLIALAAVGGGAAAVAGNGEPNSP